jgi:hypothetical protein
MDLSGLGMNFNAQVPLRGDGFLPAPGHGFLPAPGQVQGLLVGSAPNAYADMVGTTQMPASGSVPMSALSSGSGDSGIGEPDSKKPSTAKANSERLSAIQEKNRRAQKRFRERQKAKMQDMTEQLEDMGTELSKLRMQNNSLKNRNNVLEKVLTLRDEHIRALQDEQQVFDLGGRYSQQNTPLQLMGSSQQQLLLGHVENTTNSKGGGPATAMVATAEASAMVDPTDLRAIKAMPADAVINQWKGLVRELGTLLVEVEVKPEVQEPRHQEAMARLCHILDKAGQLCMHTAVLHPTNMQRLISSTLDDGRSGASAEDRSRWASVATVLRLTEEQKTQLTALRQLFVRRMCKVLEERRGVLAKLQAVTIPDRMVALQSVISETLKVNEATAALKANLQEEHLCGLEFIGTVFKTIFSPLQKARAIVQSYPFYPDIFQIASAVAAERGDESAALPLMVGAEGNNGMMASFLDIPTTYAAS